jgi:hypothetical protein
MSMAPKQVTLDTQLGTRITVPHGGAVPNRFTIWRDPYDAKWMGTTASGDQFYFGQQFNLGAKQSDIYQVLFVWRADGSFKSATIDDLGADPASATVDAARQARLSGLGAFRRNDIFVQPFGVKAFALHFGFIPRLPDSGDSSDTVWIELLPANNMAFTAPWTYGHYDT